MRFLAIICLLFMYVESAYAKDVKQQASKNTETNVQAEVNIKDLLRIDALDDRPGEYKIIARNLNSVTWPGGNMIIEIYITEYGQIEENKIAIYESNNIIDCSEKKKPENNVDSEKKEKPEYNSTFSTFGGEVQYQFKPLAVIFSINAKFFHPDKDFLNDIKNDEDFLNDIKKNIVKVSPRIFSEINRGGAPVQLNLKTKKDVIPGTYSIDINFTYFNGKEWRVSEKQVNFKVQNFFERNEGWIKWLAIIGSIVAFLLLIEYIYKFCKYILPLVQHYQNCKKAPLKK